MVFSSIPAYLDPSNWHQQQNHQTIGNTSTNPLLPPLPNPGQQPPPPPPQPHGPGGPGSIRPGSMGEQARMANIPMPETTLKCPRCDSSNTKFCYFNNYSLSQPRHFCKSCRRYWTRGGAIRNVPVGGGCRRNKRSKSTSSKSPANRSDGQTTSGSISSMSTNSGTTMLGLTPPLRFMSPLSQLSENFTNELGLNYGGISAPMVGTSEMNFHNLFGGGLLSSGSGSGGGGIDTWRMQQSFPFLGGLDNSNPNGIYQFQGESAAGFTGGGGEGSNNQLHVRPKFSSSMMPSQLTPSVKMEENPAEMNHSRQLLGGGVTAAAGNNNIDEWNINSAGGGEPNYNWTGLSNFSSSSTRNAL